MIELVIEPLENSKQKELKAWLSEKQADQLRECVLAIIHDHTGKSINSALGSVGGIHNVADYPQAAIVNIAKASEWKEFLDKLNEISSPDFQFSTIKTTKYHARHD